MARIALLALPLALTAGACRVDRPPATAADVDTTTRLRDAIDRTASSSAAVEIRVAGSVDGAPTAGLVATGSFHPGGDSELRIAGTAPSSPPPTEVRVVAGTLYQRGGARPDLVAGLGDRWLVVPSGEVPGALLGDPVIGLSAATTFQFFDRIESATSPTDGRITGTLVVVDGQPATPFEATLAHGRVVSYEVVLGTEGTTEVTLSVSLSDFGLVEPPEVPPPADRYTP